MKYTIETLQKYRLAYALLPYKRNQDIIKIHEFGSSDYCAAVVDGWDNPEYYLDNAPGKRVAEFVAQEFPKKFRASSGSAQSVADEIDKQVLEMYPARASCVGAFLYHTSTSDTIVAVGSVVVLTWDGRRWEKPKEIGDYSLDPKKYPSDVSMFFGRGELKTDPLYGCCADVAEVSSQTPVILASDGLEKVLNIRDINVLPVDSTKRSTKEIIETVLAEVVRRGTQRDDISVLLRV